MLRAGEYQVKCDGETIVSTESTNRDRDAQTFKFPCKGKELSAVVVAVTFARDMRFFTEMSYLRRR